MTAAYATFANGGMRPAPILIRRVETTEGEVLFTASPHADRAVSEATAFLITNMMADVVNSGTGWQARRVGFTLPAAGKTGTTNDYRDAWFVGYTPHLATGVWVGYDQPRTIMRNGYAGDLAVPLWGRFMSAATRGDKPDNFKAPRTITSATICRISGKLATGECYGAESVDRNGNIVSGQSVYTEYFVRGSEPVDYCPYHTHIATPPTTIFASSSPPPARPAPGTPRPRQRRSPRQASFPPRRRPPPRQARQLPLRRSRRGADSGAASSGEATAAGACLSKRPIPIALRESAALLCFHNACALGGP